MSEASYSIKNMRKETLDKSYKMNNEDSAYIPDFPKSENSNVITNNSESICKEIDVVDKN